MKLGIVGKSQTSVNDPPASLQFCLGQQVLLLEGAGNDARGLINWQEHLVVVFVPNHVFELAHVDVEVVFVGHRHLHLGDL